MAIAQLPLPFWKQELEANDDYDVDDDDELVTGL